MTIVVALMIFMILAHIVIAVAMGFVLLIPGLFIGIVCMVKSYLNLYRSIFIKERQCPSIGH
jgi:hypothetical protein